MDFIYSEMLVSYLLRENVMESKFQCTANFDQATDHKDVIQELWYHPPVPEEPVINLKRENRKCNQSNHEPQY